ncbi:MAG: hypothetical protein A3K19_28490 [Lentisphaerae bacterium RIFOXYB12_FULL_65_16]|nr:MAG: hypothetical protein A3K18_19740 [Lentisphaerae bacterium RIFOXYA12_64_32]OGV85525.1 MAG: hypothetical protein A3K19_28490 [Lentisphaerae bacterium RIFOXYB12_FULL_65_16]
MPSSYFDDITFIKGGVIPECRAVIDNSFRDMFNLQFMLSGAMHFGIDGGPRTILERPAVFWHHPRHAYQYGPAHGRHWHHHWVTFRGPRAQRLMEQGFMPQSAAGYLYVHRAREYAETFARLVALVLARDPRQHGEAVLLLEQLLWMVETVGGEEAMESPYYDGIADLAAAMHAAPCREYDFAAAARKLNLSYSHFRRLFRQLQQRSPHDFLLHARMARAAHELEDPARQVKDVAAACGYPDPARFSKLFRKKIGLSPQLYRMAVFRNAGGENNHATRERRENAPE